MFEPDSHPFGASPSGVGQSALAEDPLVRQLRGDWLGANGRLVGHTDGKSFRWSREVQSAQEIAGKRSIGLTEVQVCGDDLVLFNRIGEEPQQAKFVASLAGLPARLVWADGTIWHQAEEGDFGSKVPEEEEGRAKVQPSLAEVDGLWIETSSGPCDEPCCTISQAKVCWNQTRFWGHGSTTLFLAPQHMIGMKVGGKSFTATFTSGCPACLVWSDGEVWVRDELQGVWVNDGDETLVGTVRNGRLYWEPSLQRPTACLGPFPILPSGVIHLSPGPSDEENRATFDPGPPARLSWAHGEVWKRVSMAPASTPVSPVGAEGVHKFA